MSSRKARPAARAGAARRSAGQPAPDVKPAPPAARRRWALRVAAVILIPAAVLALLELVLLLIGYGYPVSFFIPNPVPGQSTVVENRQFSRRYFPPELMRTPGSVAFSPVRLEGTLRICVFGESAAEGDPSPAFGFARILRVLLADQYPDRTIEVLNTAVTAINSHVIRPIAGECSGYAGDFWVVYMGNNEVVGPFGAGTVFGAQAPPLGLIRAGILAKSTRSGQLLDSVLRRAAPSSAPAQWEGMEMFLKQQVREDDPRMRAVYSNFEKNLADIINYGVRSRATVILSTVGSNLRDCPPFASQHRPQLAAQDLVAWQSNYQAGVALQAQGNYAKALEQYQQAARADDRFAELEFRLARCEAALARPEEARRSFVQARDLDTLRFRADRRLNEIVRQTAAEWRSRGVRLADAEAALAQASTNGVPGAEWFYEHVHLTFAGNYLVAGQIARQVLASLPPKSAGKPLLSPAECAARLGLTDGERLSQEQEMLRRISRPPFTRQLDHAAQIARRQERIAELRQSDATNFQAAITTYEQALKTAPNDWQLHDHFAGALLQHGQRAQALAEWRQVAAILPHRVQTYDLMGSVLLEGRQLPEAEKCYEEALRIQPDFLDGLIGLGRVRLAQDRSAEALDLFHEAIRRQPRAARPYNHLALALIHLGRNPEAEQALRQALTVEPDFAAARLNLAGLLARLGRLEEARSQYAEAVRLNPDDFDAQYQLATTLIRLQKYPEAAEHLAAAVRERPDSFEAHLNYGTLLAAERKTALAAAEFQEALRLKPDFAPAHLNLGVALSAQNRFAEAIAHFQEVLRLDPGNERAQRLLQEALAQPKPAQ